jgi:hypothetical protein
VIIEDRGKGIGPLALIVPFHQQTAVAISDRVPESSHICCYHRATAGLRLKRDKTAVQVSLTTLRPSRWDRQ